MCANDGASFVKGLVVLSCIAIHCVRGARYPEHVVGISRLFHLQELSWKVLLISPPRKITLLSFWNRPLAWWGSVLPWYSALCSAPAERVCTDPFLRSAL